MDIANENINFHLSQLEEIDFRNLLFLNKTPLDLFTYTTKINKIKNKNETIDKSFFIDLIKSNQTKVYINKHYRHVINDKIFNEITSLGRRISQVSPLDFSKKLIHFISIQYSEIQNRPLDEKIINYQTTAFKIWLTFVKKLSPSQFQKIIKNIHQGPYIEESKKALVCATMLYRLSSCEATFSEHYCFNLALSGLFCEIGASLFSSEKKKKIPIINTKVFKYSSLILSIKTNLTPQNLKMISAASIVKNDNKDYLVTGQETYYFLSSYYLCHSLFNKSTFSLKKELTELKDSLPSGQTSEFKNVISRSIEFFGWK
jgi:hypothetical protein